MDTKKCFFCGHDLIGPDISDSQEAGGYTLSHNCPQCGPYVYKVQFRSMSLSNIEKAMVAGYLFETRNAFRYHEEKSGAIFRLDEKKIGEILGTSLIPKGISDKFSKVLSYLDKTQKKFGEWIEIPNAVAYAIDDTERDNILFELEQDGLLKQGKQYTSGEPSPYIPPRASLTKKGMNTVIHNKQIIDSTKCFIAMSFRKETLLDDFYTCVVKPACIEAGYEPIRVDEQSYEGYITDKIFSEIRTSKFVIADFTYQNQGVYYEAGFARGLGKTVLQLCNEDYFEKTKDKNGNWLLDHGMHFDNSQVVTIIWKNSELETAKEKLKYCITSLLGQGDFVPKS
jgi:nucleoside 2-deoxyribosyltransferase